MIYTVSAPTLESLATELNNFTKEHTGPFTYIGGPVLTPERREPTLPPEVLESKTSINISGNTNWTKYTPAKYTQLVSCYNTDPHTTCTGCDKS